MDFSFKFICIGDSGVGKSCLVLRFTNKEFHSSTETTIGIEFGSRVISIQNHKIKLQIWDTAGQESFRSISRAYYRSAIGALVVFDATKLDSFQHVQDWIRDLREYGDESTRLILVAHKVDLESLKQVPSRVAQEFATKNDMLYIESSAKSGINVDETFMELASTIYLENQLENAPFWTETEIKFWDSKGIKLSRENGNGIQINPSTISIKNSSCC